MSEQAGIAGDAGIGRTARQSVALWRKPLPWSLAAAGAALIAALVFALQTLGAPVAVQLAASAGMVLMLLTGLIAVWSMHAATRASQRRAVVWRAVGDALPFPCFVVDRTGRAVYANRSFRKQWPGSSHAPLAMLKERLGGDERVSEQVAWLARMAAGGSTAAKEVAGSGPANGGEENWLRVSVYPLGDQSRHVLWAIEDITARREMEVIIREEQAKLIDFLENAPVGFYSVDGTGKFLLMNRTLASWLGTDMETVRQDGRQLHDFLANVPDGAAAYSPFVDSDAAEGNTSRGEAVLRGGDGRRLQVSITQAVVDGDDGTGTGLRTRSVVRDLTQERTWQEALHRSEQRFHRFFEDAPVAIVLLDAAGQVTEGNRAWHEMAGRGMGRDGGNLAAFAAGRDSQRVAAWLEGLAEGGGAARLDVTIGGGGGDGERERRLSAFASRLEDGAGAHNGFIVHFLERLATADAGGDDDEQVQQARKMQAVGQLAGGIAHDFNNLLTAMIGFCDLLLLRHSPGDQSFADIMQIKQNASRAANLVRQLLAFSRQQTLQPKVLSITDVIADLSNLLRRLIGANIQLDVQHSRDTDTVRVDQGQLEQVIINLAVNARDAMPNGGRLTIETSAKALGQPVQHGSEVVPKGDYVVIRVADTGTGIPAKHLEHIFEPFFTTKEVGAGTGLGLSTVYGIVKQTGGYIVVEQTSGDGTVFAIYLPVHVAVADPAADAAPEEKPKRDLTGAGTILLVEDEDAVRLFSARALRAKGYNVLEARTGEAALELIGETRDEIDLMITDVVMPEMDGPTLIKEMRERMPDLRIICISGYAEDSFRKKIGEGDIRFLAKPFSLSQLAETVKEAFE